MSNSTSQSDLILSGRLATDNLDELIKELGVPDILPEDLFFWRWSPSFAKKVITRLSKKEDSFLIGLFALSPLFVVLTMSMLAAFLLPSWISINVSISLLILAVIVMIPTGFWVNSYEEAAKRLNYSVTKKRTAIFEHCKNVIKKYETDLLDPIKGKFPGQKMTLDKKLYEASRLHSRLETNLKRCQPGTIRHQELNAALQRAEQAFDALYLEDELNKQRTQVIESCLISMHEKVDEMDLDLAIADCMAEVSALEDGSAGLINGSTARFHQLVVSLAEDINKLNSAFGYPALGSSDAPQFLIPDDSEFKLLSATIASNQMSQLAGDILPELEHVS